MAIEGLKVGVQALKDAKSDPVQCALHNEAITRLLKRMDDAEAQLGKKNTMIIGLGALGMGIGMALKWGVTQLLDMVN